MKMNSDWLNSSTTLKRKTKTDERGGIKYLINLSFNCIGQ